MGFYFSNKIQKLWPVTVPPQASISNIEFFDPLRIDSYVVWKRRVEFPYSACRYPVSPTFEEEYSRTSLYTVGKESFSPRYQKTKMDAMSPLLSARTGICRQRCQVVGDNKPWQVWNSELKPSVAWKFPLYGTPKSPCENLEI